MDYPGFGVKSVSRRVLFASAAILLILCAASVYATTYYVDATGGNDSKSGTSNTTAWKTVSKVGDMWGSLNPGDTVLFKRGETWWLSDTWYAKGGNATHRMTYGSYGTGAQPVLKGSPLITNWTLYSGSIYRTTVVAEWGLSQIFIDGTFGDRRGGSVSNVTNNYDWYWENNTLYLYDSSGDPDDRHSPGVEATLFGVIGTGDNVNYANLTISQGGDGMGGWETSNLTLTNMTFEWNWCNGFAINSGIDYGNIIVQDGIARYNGCSGIGFAIVNNTGSNFTVRRNTVYGNGKYQGTWDYYQTWSTGIKFWGPTGLNDILIENNTCSDNSDRGADIWLDFASPTDPSHANIIRNNLIHDSMGIGIFMESTSDTLVYNNILYNTSNSDDWGVFTNGGIKIDAREGTGSHRNRIYNNIVVGGYNGMFLATYSQWQGDLMMNNSIRNNIFINQSAAALQTIDGPDNDGAYGSGNVYEYNTFGAARSGIVRWDYTEYDTYAAWEIAYCGSANCSHSVQQNPTFVNAAAHDYHSLSSSSVIDNGTIINITMDYDGNSRPKGAGYDIGPYEYTPPGNVAPDTPTPAINSSTGTNFSDQDLNCYDTLVDGNGDSMNVSVRWYRNGALNRTTDYNNNYADLYAFVSTLYHGNLSVGQNWSCSMSVSDGTNQTAWGGTGNLTVRIVTYTPPTTPSPNISSADGTNYSNQSLNCYGTLSDPDANSMNVSVRWYRNGTLNRTVDYNNSYGDGYSFVATLGSGNLTSGERWSCGMRLTDPWNQSQWGNSTNITIRYTPAPPTMASLTLNATDNPVNSTNANLTVTPAGLSEVNGDPVNIVYDWRLNGTSIAIINMNFDVNNSNGTGKVRDYSTHNNNGTISAVTWNATGGRNGSGAYENTGYNGITVSNKPSLNFSTITVAIWYKSHPHTNSYGIFGKQDWTGGAWSGLGRIMLMNDNTTQFEFHTADGWNYLNTAKVPNDVWIHYVATYNGSRATVYINGAANATTTANGPLVDNYISDLGFGGMDGVIDEVQIFNRSLSATQVKALYENKTNILVSNETVVGNNWSVCATPNNRLFDGNTTCSNALRITSGAYPPTISAVANGSITNQSAVITWSTDMGANSTVRYGTTLALSSSISNASFGTSHSVALSGLINNTLYYYNITSCNSYGNCSTNGTRNFTTLQNTLNKTYYVDATGGNDSNSGTSNTTAWKTIAKVNAASFNPGDTILFRRGETWREQLTVPSSGNATSRITFGAYGSGAKPIISGADLLSANWTPELVTLTGFTSDPNIQAYWMLEEAAGASRSDGTGHGNTLADHNTVGQNASHKQGSYSARFTRASSQYLSRTDAGLSAGFIGKSGTTNSDFTYGAWVLFSSVNDTTIFQKGNLSLTHWGGGWFTATLHDSGGWHTEGTSFAYNELNTWHHVVVRYTGSTDKELSLFIDGGETSGTTTCTDANIETSTDDLQIGGTGVWSLDGLVDEVFVFNRALNDSEILRIYNGGLAGSSFNAYYTPLASSPTQTFANDTRLPRVASKDLMTLGTSYYDSNNTRIYVRTPGDTAPGNYTMSRSVRNYCVLVDAKDSLSFGDLYIDKANAAGIQVTHHSNNLTFASIDILGAFRQGLYIGTAAGGAYTIDNVVFANGTASYCGGAGIAIQDATDFITISNNSVHHNNLISSGDIGGVVGDHDYQAGIKLTGYESDINQHALIERNTVYSNGKKTPQSYDGSGIWLDGPVVFATIRYNTVYDNTGNGIRNEDLADDNEIYNNLLYDNMNNDIEETSGTYNYRNRIYNNIAYSSGRYYNTGIMVGGALAKNNSIRNNIAIGHYYGNLVVQQTASNTGGGSGNVYEYNSFGTESNDFIWWNYTTYSTYSAWEAAYCGSTGCSHSMQQNPQFVNATGFDFRSLPSSPVIDAGMNVNLTADFAGNPVPSGAAPDIGAFEYQSNGTPAPTISSVQNTSITNQSVVISWTTNLAANESVRYGLTTALLNSSLNSSFGTSHSMTLSGLVNNTRYYYNITACNSGGNCSTNGTFNFTTLQNSAPPPVISLVQNTSITNQSAVISWLTNISANSTVRYGTTTALSSSTSNASFGTSHSMTLSGLTNNTRYYYNVTSCNSYGNCSTNGTYNFTTTQNAVPAPVISSVQNTSITNQSVVISWTTNLAANESVRYGLTTALANSSSNTTFGTSHSRTLSGLTNNTRYYYNITACNAGGNCSTNGTYNFTTSQNAVPAPVISLVRNVSITNQSALINWSTDIAANETVRYGTSLALSSSLSNVSFGTSHALSLSGLVNNTRYYYNITVCNSGGNCSTNGTYNFTTSQSAIPAPVISSVQNTPITNQSAIITWSTDIAANETVRYGTTLALSSSSSNASFGTSHALTLSSLTNNTRYYYNITACNSGGNCSTNGTYNFTTSQNTASTTYYVDATGGNDSNNGLSTSTAWKTMTRICGVTFTPGNQILFKRGETWRLSSTCVVSAGNATARITYGAYGSGVQPVLKGSDLVTGWTVYSGSIYQATVTTDVKQIFVDGTFGDRRGGGVSNISNNYDWYRDNSTNTLYLYDSSGNPDNRHSPGVEATVRNVLQPRSNTNFENITVVQGLSGVFGWEASNVTLTNMTLEWNWVAGAYLSSDINYGNIVVQDSIARYNGAHGMTFTISNGTASNFTVRRNHVYENAKYQGRWDSWQQYTSGIKFWGPTGMQDILIEQNDVYDNGFAGSWEEVGIWLDYASPTSPTHANIIRNNVVHDDQLIGIFLEGSSDALVYNNVLYDNAKSEASIYINTREDRTANRNRVYNNIVVGGYNGLVVETWGQWAGCNVSNNSIKNNIFVNTSSAALVARDGGDNIGPYGSGNVYDYNTFGAQKNSFISWNHTGHNTYSAWETVYCGSTNCSHSVQQNPTFVNAAAHDYHPLPNSSAIDAGTSVGLAVDYDGNPVPNGAAPDIGAFEYQSSDTFPPVISSVQNTSITNQSAVISWLTNISANSTVRYGTTTALSSSTSNASFGTSHSMTLSGLTNNTRYYYNITACNIYGNCSTTGPYNVTTSKTTTPPRGGDGGGGGGGGGGVPLPSVDATQTWFNLKTGQGVLFRVNKQNISITNITFLTRQALKQLTLSLTIINDTPPPPSGVLVYQVDKVESGVADTAGTDFVVSFRIEKAWLDEHRIAEVLLYRLESDTWHAYQPIRAGDDVQYAHYTATISGLSLFLVGGKSAAPPLQPVKTSNETLNTSPVGTPSAALNETRPETASNETSPVAPERTGLSFGGWMLILFSIIVVAGVIVLIIRHERRLVAGDLDHRLILLREFVKKGVENGHTPAEVEQALVQHGWQQKYIDWAFKECGIAPPEPEKEEPSKEEVRNP